MTTWRCSIASPRAFRSGRRDGHVVLELRGARSRRCTRRPYDVLITDVRLGSFNGLQLALLARDLYPQYHPGGLFRFRRPGAESRSRTRGGRLRGETRLQFRSPRTHQDKPDPLIQLPCEQRAPRQAAVCGGAHSRTRSPDAPPEPILQWTRRMHGLQPAKDSDRGRRHVPAGGSSASVPECRRWKWSPIPLSKEHGRRFTRDSFDALLTDVRLGAFNGLQLAMISRDAHPDIRDDCVFGI